jgi:hypothetical protein
VPVQAVVGGFATGQCELEPQSNPAVIGCTPQRPGRVRSEAA